MVVVGGWVGGRGGKSFGIQRRLGGGRSVMGGAEAGRHLSRRWTTGRSEGARSRRRGGGRGRV
jgi:hypothetical protein